MSDTTPGAPPGPDRAGEQVSISPYVLFRRTRLPLETLEPLRFTATWAAFDESRQRAAALDDATSAMSDVLAEAVAAADDEHRRAVVALRRDVHNHRLDRVEERTAELGGSLPSPVAAQLADWLRTARGEQDSRRRAHDELARERQLALAAFPALFDHDAMATSIQLSGQQLYDSLARHLSGSGSALKPSRVRTIESSLINYAYRAALKPSPFGRFTEVGAFPPDLTAASAGPPQPTHSDVTLNRVLLNWLVGAMQRFPGGADARVLLLNSSLRSDGTTVEFIGMRTEAGSGSGPREAVVRLRRDALVDAVLASMPDGWAPAAGVVAALAEHAGDPAKARGLLDALVRTGLLFVRPGLDDQDPNYSDALADVLARWTAGPSRVIHECMTSLRRLEARVPEADVAERQELLDAARTAIDAVTSAGDVAAPPQSVVRSPVYEDAWTADAASTWDLAAIRRATPALDSLWRFASTLDYGQVKRLGLYEFAVEGADGRDRLPFVSFFDRFSRLETADQGAVLGGVRSEQARRFRERRREMLRTLAAELGLSEAEADGADEVSISPERLRELCDQVEGRDDPLSTTYRLQLADDAGRVVVNGMLTGYGTYFSRFSSFVDRSPAEGWTLRAAVRDHLAEVFPGQTDLNAVLGFNFNLHPQLTERTLDYPGCWPASGRTYQLRDLDVRLDHERQRLVLHDPAAQQDLDLVPMNFLIPVGVPVLYQVLETISPTTRYQWAPLADIRLATGVGRPPASVPRFTVGEVIADRRTWTVDAGVVPDLEGLSRDDADALFALDRWRSDRGLPRRAFVVTQTAAEHDALSGRTGGPVRDWADFEHLHKASVHKPMYIDFRNPYLVRSLAKSALTRDGVQLSVRECVPDVVAFPSSRPRVTEEFFVELNRGGRG